MPGFRLGIAGKVLDERARLWTLRRADAEVCCEARLLRGGIQGRIVWNGSELYAFLVRSGDELWEWAREKRDELEAKGRVSAATARDEAAARSRRDESRSS